MFYMLNRAHKMIFLLLFAVVLHQFLFMLYSDVRLLLFLLHSVLQLE